MTVRPRRPAPRARRTIPAASDRHHGPAGAAGRRAVDGGGRSAGDSRGSLLTSARRVPDPPDPFPGYGALRDRVEAALDAALAPGGAVGGGCPDRLRAAMRHSLLAGGKRLRPALVLLSCRACGGDDARPDAVRAAVAAELVHTYSLVHDDLPAMDDDALRRGRPTCHVAFDEATAILAGDGLLTLAFGLLAEVRPATAAAACVAELAAAAGAAGMVGGQAADLAAEGRGPARPRAGDRPRTGEELEAIHRRKTGALIAAACGIGGTLADAPPDRLDALRSYGANLGLAFQIADDLLDLSADAATLGKTAGKDLAAGKLTYPALYGAAGSRRRADELTDAAAAALAPFGPPADPLRALARYAVERDR